MMSIVILSGLPLGTLPSKALASKFGLRTTSTDLFGL